MRISYILLACMLLPVAYSLQFLTPADGTEYTGVTLVNFTWDQSDVLFSINSTTPQPINETNLSVQLDPGNYNVMIALANDTNITANISLSVLSVPAQNESQNNSQNITQYNTSNYPQNTTQNVTQNNTNSTQPTLNITITTDQASYEVGTSSRIRVIVSSPAQLNLVIRRNSATIDAYTINVQQQTDFLYNLAATGTYTVTATGQNSTGTASFIARNTTVGATIGGASVATVGYITTFTAQVSSGTPPYAYNWQFSDNTTSTGASTDHVFSQTGPYSVKLLVQDSTGKQATVTKQVTVNDQLYDIAVTVMSNTNRLLNNATVTVYDNRGGKSQITNSFGEADFSNLSISNYTINITYADNRFDPAVLYANTQTVELLNDKNVLVRFAVPDSITNTTNQTNTTQTINTTNQTNSTGTANQTAVTTTQTTGATDTTSAALSSVQNQQSTPQLSAETVAQQAFEQTRSEKMDELRSVQANILRSDEKRQVLDQLDKLSLYDAAKKKIQQAATADAMDEALNAIPKEVVVLAKDTTIIKIDTKNIDAQLQQFFTARSIPSSDQAKYRYNIEQALLNTTIMTNRTVTRITDYSDQQHTYTIISRTAKAPDAMSFVEFIPKNAASDASQLHISGSHEVLQADPIIRFLTPTYSYYVENEVSEEPAVLPVPMELTDPPGLIGYVAIKLRLTSFDRGGLYLILLGVILGAVILGNVYLRKNSSSSLPEFIKLTDLTLDTIEQGHYEIAAKYAIEVKGIHSTLSPAEQAETQDIVTYILDAAGVHQFHAATTHLHTLIDMNDSTAICPAYENVMKHYESLSENFQSQEKKTLDDINQAIEQHLTTREQS